jgi:SNF2 family DNA or RNA helicase
VYRLNPPFQILDLHGIHALELNGQTPMKKRKDILDKFRSSTRPDGVRVLILSGVGMVGLNLACANIMVVMVCVLLLVFIFVK